MQIAIQQVTFPQPGRKFGKLQLSDGQTVWVPPELLGQFRGGMTCEVGTKQQTWGQGVDARHVTIVTTGPMGPGMASGGNAYQQPYGQAQVNQAPQRPNTGFQPRVVEGGARPYGSPRDPGEAKMIFVTGVVGRAMGSGKFTASEIAVLAQEAARTYDLVTAPSPKPQLQGQPSDEPPQYPDGEPVG
jgi:hypothetical protein